MCSAIITVGGRGFFHNSLPEKRGPFSMSTLRSVFRKSLGFEVSRVSVCAEPREGAGAREGEKIFLWSSDFMGGLAGGRDSTKLEKRDPEKELAVAATAMDPA